MGAQPTLHVEKASEVRRVVQQKLGVALVKWKEPLGWEVGPGFH